MQGGRARKHDHLRSGRRQARPPGCAREHGRHRDRSLRGIRDGYLRPAAAHPGQARVPQGGEAVEPDRPQRGLARRTRPLQPDLLLRGPGGHRPAGAQEGAEQTGPPMNLAIAQQTYIVESRELLRDMESALLRLEKAPRDAEAITAVFRAAHTIKGSSGAVNFDAIVEFTHAMESVLEQIRSGNLPIDGKLIALLLVCGDHLSALLDCLAADDRKAAFERIRENGESLLGDLGAYLGTPQLPAGETREPEVERIGAATVASDDWHISLRFGRSLLRNGLDPLSFIRYLGSLGKISQVTTVFDAMPDAADMDPEACYLGMELGFNGAVTKEAIEDVFEYLREDCAIRILPPHSRISDYVDLINALPEDKVRLGELLVKSGALTRRELDAGLRIQAEGAKRRIGEILVGQGAGQIGRAHG